MKTGKNHIFFQDSITYEMKIMQQDYRTFNFKKTGLLNYIISSVSINR